jgi:carbonic anhydrase
MVSDAIGPRFRFRIQMLILPVVIVGHSGCGGCIASFEAPKDAQLPDSPLFRFIDPLIKLGHSLPEGSNVNDLIRENVKQSVRNVVESSVSLCFDPSFLGQS